MQVSFLQRAQDSRLSKTEWRTTQVSTERPRPNKQLQWPLRPLPQSASLLQLPATTLTLFYRAQIPSPTKLGPRATAACKLRHQELTFGARMRSSRYWQLPEKRNGASAGNEMLRRPNMRSRINTCFLPALSGNGRLSPMLAINHPGAGASRYRSHAQFGSNF